MTATATATATPRRRSASVSRRLLGSSLVDVLVGPHGIDRYLELIRPSLTIADARAEVLGVRHQTSRSVTLTLRPNAAFGGFRAGQFVKVGVEIDGVRRTRTYSPACSEHAYAADGRLELTITLRDAGLVSGHLREHITPGTILHLGAAAGDFVLPERRPDRLALISGGSGITPVISMLRTLLDEDHDGEIAFVHYARAAADHLYLPELQRLAAAHPKLSVDYIATRERGRHLSEQTLPPSLTRAETTHAAVCGPPALIDAVRAVYGEERVIAETFTPPTLAVSGAAASGTLRFLDSGQTAEITTGTLLEQAEASGLSPDYGCRMGICHTCTCRKTAGAVKNILTGEVSDEEDEDIQLCISVPAGDVALEL
jgi:ferredoxin-NADP reductase